MKILAFLEARLGEAEAEARGEQGPTPVSAEPSAGSKSDSLRALKLARVTAMRRVVAEHERDRFSRICLTCRPVGSDDGWASEAWPCPTIRHIAALWAGHPAYDAFWSPQPVTMAPHELDKPRRRRASNGSWLLDVSAVRSTS